MRAATVCAEPGCPEPATYRGRCSAHRWRQSTWPQRKRARRVRERARHRCVCGAKVPPGTGAVDHIVPLALGGTDNLSNLQLLCERCDRIKTRADRRRIARRRRG
jgi:5-methylcytosine-specific restriction enzyme A